MAFFDELSKKISQTSQGVVQKTKDTAEILKLNSAISDEEKKINSFYTELGKAYFEKYCDSCEEDFQNTITSIKESQAKVEQFSEQVKKLKGIVRCPNCNNDVQYGSPFCNSCGTKLETEKPAPTVADKKCTKCGAPLGENSAFCTRCGAKVEQPAPANEKTCTNCGNLIGDSAFCTRCGTKVEQPVAQPQTDTAQDKKTCPVCNQSVPATCAFCIHCGTSLN